MNEIRRIKTPIATVAIYDSPRIMKTVFDNIKLESIEDAKEHTRQCIELLNEFGILPDIVDIRPLISTAKAIRDYFGNDPEVQANSIKSAIIINSGLSRMIGNIFIRLSKNAYPTKLFTDEEKALEWLISDKN